MPVQNVIIKSSFDTLFHPKLDDYLINFSQGAWVELLCGAGTQMNEVLKKLGIESEKSPHGRILPWTYEVRKIYRDTCDEVVMRKENELITKGISGVHLSPAYEIRHGMIIPQDADMKLRCDYISYDKAILVTTEDRVEEKIYLFQEFPRIRIIGL